MVSHVFTGAAYKYTTYGWTLLGAVIEAASGMEYLKYMKHCVFKPLGMSSTGPEYHQPLMYHRARYVCVGLGGSLIPARCIHPPFVVLHS